MHISKRLRWGALLAASLSAALGGTTACADPLLIGKWTVAGGGSGFVDAGSITLGGTAGQPSAGLVPAPPEFVVLTGFWAPGVPVTVGVEGAGDDPATLAPPVAFAIHPVTPNPFMGRTRVAFDLPEAREADIRVYDVRGARVRTLASGVYGAGRHALEWNGADDAGSRVHPGLYLVRIRLGAVQHSQKLIVLR